jgi:glycine betaine transporter
MTEKFFGKIDKPVFIISLIICGSLTLFGFLNPTLIDDYGKIVNGFIGTYFSWWYILAVCIYLVCLAYCAFGPYGRIKLGKDDEKPEYSFFSWFAMLFNAGLGVGFLFYAAAEPLYHFMQPPPLGGAPGSPEALVNTFRQYVFNWGIHGWAPYAVIGLAIAYFTFRLGRPLTVATGLIGFLGDNPEKTFWGKVINTLTVFATLFGSATSLGLGVMQIRYGLNYIFGIPSTTFTAITATVIIAILYIWSSVRGIDKGIKIFSNSNQWIAIGFMCFFFVLGPTTFILNIFTNTIGAYLNDLLKISFWTDPINEGEGWLAYWTVFYWAWFISWSPWVGGFIARISRGRTVREFIVGALLVPALFALTWVSTIGASAVHAQSSGHDLFSIVQKSIEAGLFSLFELYPLFVITGPVIILSAAIFFITGADAASFTVAMIMNEGDLSPTKGMKIMWGVFMALVALVLMLGGGLAALQSASLVSALPFSIAIFIFMYSVIKGFQNDASIAKGYLPPQIALRGKMREHPTDI